MEFQYQQEIVRKTFWQRFDIAIGHCKKCQKRWQGRDPRQTSDALGAAQVQDRKSTRLNSSHSQISYAVFCLKKKKKMYTTPAYVVPMKLLLPVSNFIVIIQFMLV